jgi:hypothetical protein
MWKETADKGVAVVAEVISEGKVAEWTSEGKFAVTGVVSLPSFGLFAAGMMMAGGGEMTGLGGG